MHVPSCLSFEIILYIKYNTASFGIPGEWFVKALFVNFVVIRHKKRLKTPV
jgi:hypothetical protein